MSGLSGVVFRSIVALGTLGALLLACGCSVKVSDDVKHFERRAFTASRDDKGLLVLRMPIEGWNRVSKGPYEMSVVGDWKGQRRGFDLSWGDGQVEWVAKLIYSESFVRALAEELGVNPVQGKPLERIPLVGSGASEAPKELDLPAFRMTVDLEAGWVEWREKDAAKRQAWIASFY